MTNWITCPNCQEIDGDIILCSHHRIPTITIPYRNGMTLPTGTTYGRSHIYRTPQGQDMIVVEVRR